MYVSFVEGVHMAVWQKAVGKKGKENEFREREKLITR
jgi:hypothetical protein